MGHKRQDMKRTNEEYRNWFKNQRHPADHLIDVFDKSIDFMASTAIKNFYNSEDEFLLDFDFAGLELPLDPKFYTEEHWQSIVDYMDDRNTPQS
jgi:hypothetical protein